MGLLTCHGASTSQDDDQIDQNQETHKTSFRTTHVYNRGCYY